MMAASAATGFRTWLQNHRLGWLTPRRAAALTIGAMCAAGAVSTVWTQRLDAGKRSTMSRRRYPHTAQHTNR